MMSPFATMMMSPFATILLLPAPQGAACLSTSRGCCSNMRAGYSVVAETCYHGDSVRAHEAVRRTWPERYGSKSAARKAIRRQLVQDGDGVSLRSGDVAVAGQIIRLIARTSPGPAPGEGRRRRSDTPVDCVYEDDDLAIIFKPAGVSVQGDVRAALANGLQPTRHRDERSMPLWRPQHVHRLDAPTSGLR